MSLPRDGVIHANGLSAEFRFVRPHGCKTWSVIETALGQTALPDTALIYDPPRDLTPEAAKVVEEHKP